MSKITFRADNDLVERVEQLDISKSEVMREALRSYLESDEVEQSLARREADSLDALVAQRVDEMLADQLDELFAEHSDIEHARTSDVNVTLVLEGGSAGESIVRDAELRQSSDTAASSSDEAEQTAGTGDLPEDTVKVTEDEDRQCGQCGETLAAGHVFCPNCGEKASRRVFCECGDEVRTDWSFCPSCGRRTPAADVLDQQS